MSLFKRVRLPGLLVGALALALVGCGGGGGSGGSDSSDAEENFAVVQEIPTNGQQVSGKLEGVSDNQISIEFSTALDESTILDPTNPFNGLSSSLTMLDNTLYRVPGTPEVKGKYFRFIPPSTGLPNQQYTLSVTRNVTSAGGQALMRDFYTSFTVGDDMYDPIVRRAYPVQNQNDVPRNSVIRVTFNESLDPASVSTQTVLVQDGGVSPATPVNGTISLENNGFEIVFTPDPWAGLPPNTTVVVTLIGGDAGIADKTAGRPFMGSGSGPAQQWSLQFNTEAGGDPINQYARHSCYFLDSNSFGVIDISTYTTGGDPYLNPAAVGTNSRRKVGRPLDMVLDSRVDFAGDTVAYVADGDSGDVLAISTFNSRVFYRLKVGGGARGIGIIPTGHRLYVSQFGADELVAYDLTNVSPTQLFLQTTSKARLLTNIQIGRGPLGVAHAPDQSTVFVANSLEGTCSVISTTTNAVLHTVQVGSYPQDVGVTVTFVGFGYFALVSNLGAGDDPGSCSLWRDRNPDVSSWTVTGVQNPKGVAVTGGAFYVSNSGSSGVSRFDLWGTPVTVEPRLTNTYVTGEAPQNVALDPVGPVFGFASCRGDGLVTVINLNDNSVIYPHISVPGVQFVATLMSQ